MPNVLEVVAKLEASKTRLDKEQILFDSFMNGHREFFTLAKLAFDPFVSFSVKKVAQIEEGEDDSNNLSFNDFAILAKRLRSRELTGNNARDAINMAALRCEINLWNNVYRRVLLKDFKTGTDVKAINKVLKKIVVAEPSAKDYLIPIFGCQLPQDGKKHNKHKGTKLLDAKQNGERAIVVLDKEFNTVSHYSRNGAVNDDSPIAQSLAKILPKLPGSIVLDGEIVSGRLAIIDIIPLNDFKDGESKIPQYTRHQILTAMATSGIFQETCGASAYVVPKILVDLDSDDGQQTLVEYSEMNPNGIIIKDPDANYVTKRSVAWIDYNSESGKE